jgi:hypothetical protein
MAQSNSNHGTSQFVVDQTHELHFLATLSQVTKTHYVKWMLWGS